MVAIFACSQTFWFSNGNVTTFPKSRKYENFNFSICTVPAEMPYLQKYLTNFEKLFFRWKKRKVAFVVENFKVHRHFRFPMATLQLFQHSRKCKNFNFSLHTVPAEMPYLQKYLTNFQKLFFFLVERRGRCNSNIGIFCLLAGEYLKCTDVGNFKCTDILVFQWQRYNFSNIPKM